MSTNPYFEPAIAPSDRDQAPDLIDTRPRPADGDQDVDQDPGYEEAEAQLPDEPNDPEVGEVA